MAAIMKVGIILLFCVAIFAVDNKNKENDTTFCCDAELEVVEVNVVKVKPVKKTKFEEREVIVGYKDCGIVGQNVCPIYDYVWDDVVYYAMEDVIEKESYTVPCPPSHLVCCEGYSKYQDNCYKPEEIEKLKNLELLGIIG